MRERLDRAATSKALDLYLNSAAREALDIPRDEDVTRIYVAGLVSPEEFEACTRNALDRSMQRDAWCGEMVLFSRGGRKIPVEVVLFAHRSETGSVERLSLMARDVTELRRAEHALRQSEQRRRITEEAERRLSRRNEALVQALGEIVYEWRPAAGMLDWAGDYFRILGYSAEEIGGDTQSRLSRIHPEDRPAVAAEVEIARHERGIYDIEYRFLRSDGAYAWMHDRGVVSVDSIGETERVIGVLRDITERKGAEAELRANRARIAMLSRQLMTARETERRNLARELHDEIGQVLTAVLYNVQLVRAVSTDAAVARMDQTIEIVNRAIESVRDLSFNLRPPGIDDSTLQDTLGRYALNWARRTGVPVNVQVPQPETLMTPELKTACFRVVQEALTNIERHAQAKRVSLRVNRRTDGIEIAIQDNGTGFDPAVAWERADGAGLRGMRERVELLRGRFTVDSTPDWGTTVRAHFPWTDPISSNEDGDLYGS